MTKRRPGLAVPPAVRNRSQAVARAVAFGLAGGAVVAGGLCGCAQDPMPFDPRLAQQWERTPDDQTKVRQLYPLPTTQETPFVPGETTPRPRNLGESRNHPSGPAVRMTLREVVHRAIANNLNVRVAGFDTAIDQTRVLEAQANFDPQFFSDLSFQDVNKQVGGGDAFRVIPGHNPFSNRAVVNGQSVFQSFISRVDKEALTVFDAGFRQNLEAGGRIEVRETVNNSWFYPTRTLLNPYYENDLVLTLTQPLLQNFGVAVNAARITIAQNTQRVSLLEFRRTVEDTVLRIEQTYWELVQAERDVTTDQALVKASEDTAELLYKRQGQDVTASQIQQANAQTEARRVDLLSAQSRVDDLSDQLKQLMNDPSFPVSGNAFIEPADDFLKDPLKFNVDDQIETALENRLELGQQQVRILSAETAVDVARNGLLPSLALTLEGTVNGLNRTLPGSFNNQGDFNHLGYQAGLQFQLPIGNRAARAVWQRSLMQRLQAIASYAELIEQVTLEVKLASRALTTSYERLHTSQNAVFGFEKLLESLRAQELSGGQPLTFDFIFNVLQDQDLLANAQRAEHLASNDYSYAIANLERAKGTILRYNNVVMEQEQLPADLELPGNPEPLPTPPGYPFVDHVGKPGF